MKIDRYIYSDCFLVNNIPNWNCPECRSGIITVPKNGVKTFEYPSSKRLHDRDDWEPEWILGCFTGILICNNKKCKCNVVFSGDIQ